jgi:hypothetical protein
VAGVKYELADGKEFLPCQRRRGSHGKGARKPEVKAALSFLRAAGLLVAGCFIVAFPAHGQTQTYRAPRTASGQPDFNGFWQALNTSALGSGGA